MLIGEFFQSLNDLICSLHSCQNVIDIEAEEIKKIYGWNDNFKIKRAADKLSKEEEKQLRFDIQLAYSRISKLLNKS